MGAKAAARTSFSVMFLSLYQYSSYQPERGMSIETDKSVSANGHDRKIAHASSGIVIFL